MAILDILNVLLGVCASTYAIWKYIEVKPIRRVLIFFIIAVAGVACLSGE